MTYFPSEMATEIDKLDPPIYVNSVYSSYLDDRLQTYSGNESIIGMSAFYSCTTLKTVSFPVCTTISSSAFQGCRSLTTASFPTCTSIYTDAFRYCYRLISLYLNGSSVCTLSNSNAFSSTPIGGYSTSAGKYGSIYVPASLLASYQAATGWTYFSSRFVGV